MMQASLNAPRLMMKNTNSVKNADSPSAQAAPAFLGRKNTDSVELGASKQKQVSFGSWRNIFENPFEIIPSIQKIRQAQVMAPIKQVRKAMGHIGEARTHLGQMVDATGMTQELLNSIKLPEGVTRKELYEFLDGNAKALGFVDNRLELLNCNMQAEHPSVISVKALQHKVEPIGGVITPKDALRIAGEAHQAVQGKITEAVEALIGTNHTPAETELHKIGKRLGELNTARMQKTWSLEQFIKGKE